MKYSHLPSPSVAGQVYDYLVGLLGMGVSLPVAVFSAYMKW
jgi:hypothetical protein